MSGISMRIDARKFRSDVSELLDRKIRGITSNTNAYDEISRLLVRYLKDSISDKYDTGALVDQKHGYSDKTGYYREGYLEVSKSHGILWDAYEDRPSGFRHYAQAVIGKALGIHDGVNGENVREAMMSNGTWEEFLAECEPILIKYLQGNHG